LVQRREKRKGGIAKYCECDLPAKLSEGKTPLRKKRSLFSIRKRNPFSA